jgi:hypothetical protein
MKKKKQRTLELSKPATGAGAAYGAQPEKRVVKIKPFKARRDLLKYPVRKGNGVTINGWQFEVISISPNGKLHLKPIGKIIEDLMAPKAKLKQEDPPDDKADNNKKL